MDTRLYSDRGTMIDPIRVRDFLLAYVRSLAHAPDLSDLERTDP